MGQFVNLSFWFDTFLDWTDLNFRKHSSLKQFSSRCAPWVVLVLLCFMFLGVVSLLGVTGFGRFLSWFVCPCVGFRSWASFFQHVPLNPSLRTVVSMVQEKFGVCLQWHRSRRYFQRTLNCKKKQSWHLQQWQSFVPTFILAVAELIGVLRFSPSYCDYVVWGYVGVISSWEHKHVQTV